MRLKLRLIGKENDFVSAFKPVGNIKDLGKEAEETLRQIEKRGVSADDGKEAYAIGVALCSRQFRAMYKARRRLAWL